jgi:hypothetical protein
MITMITSSGGFVMVCAVWEEYMSTSASDGRGFLARLLDRLKSTFVGKVPEDIGFCEFDCKKSQCTYGEWATCQRRIEYQRLCDAGFPTPALDASEDMLRGSE